jgi:hypothetical protein
MLEGPLVTVYVMRGLSKVCVGLRRRLLYLSHQPCGPLAPVLHLSDCWLLAQSHTVELLSTS